MIAQRGLQILRQLDSHSLLTAFSTLALQYQFLRISGFFSPQFFQNVFFDLYFLAAGLMFFSMVIVYRLDHLWDRKLPIRHPQAAPYTLVTFLSLGGILIWLITGWEIWDLEFLLWGLATATLCAVHLLVFHSPLQRWLFPIKEVSVAMTTVVGIITILFYLKYSHRIDLLNPGLVGVLFLTVINSVLFYSWTRHEKDHESGVVSLFHHFTFSQSQRWLLSLIFFSLIAQLVLLNRHGFSEVDRLGSGEFWYFPTVTIAQGLLVKGMGQSPELREKFRLFSEGIFLFLLPFFLW